MNLPRTVRSGSMISRFERFPNSLCEYLDKSIALGLMVALFFTTLAHGAVEPWSAGLFELMLTLMLLLWGIKATLNRSLEVTIPTAALP